jgi:4-hydroxybenzoate polyprenyltransferase
MISEKIKTLRAKLWTYGERVMFSHTLFSLPFALIAMFLAAEGLPSLHIFLWSMAALFAGRNGANSLNRWVDASYDAKNPRTKGRHIPAGRVMAWEALAIAIACFAVFIFAAAQLNTLCLMLSPVALLLFIAYSYTKRFTWLCHVVLGVTCAGAPVGAWLAVTGSFHYIPLLFAVAVTLWIAGFDIIYGTQDIDFDRREGLFSIPARFGLKGSLLIARAFHLVMWLIMLSLAHLTMLSWIYVIGVAVSAPLLVFEHYMVNPANRGRMNIASYHINQVIAVILLVASVLDIFILN